MDVVTIELPARWGPTASITSRRASSLNVRSITLARSFRRIVAGAVEGEAPELARRRDPFDVSKQLAFEQVLPGSAAQLTVTNGPLARLPLAWIARAPVLVLGETGTGTGVVALASATRWTRSQNMLHRLVPSEKALEAKAFVALLREAFGERLRH